MDRCDVLIVGGGPAGSSCAWKLVQSGLDVVIVDRAVFPRDKVCAGWVTPAVLRHLGIDREDYGKGRTLQPITAFRLGVIGRDRSVRVDYGREVSFAIRRCEFDDYLVQRSGARLVTGEAVTSVRRDGSQWVVNDRFSAPMLVGAGGHFCPVSRLLNGSRPGGPVVAAQEVELPLNDEECPTAGSTPEIYFCKDLQGYGWCVRKGPYVNVGLGRFDRRSVHGSVDRFVGFLRDTRRLTGDISSWKWRGHAYEVASGRRRIAASEGVVLVGDAAGLADPISGEGIRPAIESGIRAAMLIRSANGHYDAEQLQTPAAADAGPANFVPAWMLRPLARRALQIPWFVRRVVLDRWFLHAS
jgi:flavin-dependent dehydrogenase